MGANLFTGRFLEGQGFLAKSTTVLMGSILVFQVQSSPRLSLPKSEYQHCKALAEFALAAMWR